jgi:hypothetical protein
MQKQITNTSKVKVVFVCATYKMCFRCEDQNKLELKLWEQIYKANSEHKENEVTILLSDIKS